jgi:plastocyanin
MTKTIQRLLAVAAVTTFIGLGACGGGDDDDTTSETGSGVTTTTADDSGASSSASTDGSAVEISEFTFKPATLNVKMGSEVTFSNKDGFAHTATADDGSFDSKNIDGGSSFKQAFEKAGTFKYHCDIHNSMHGTITVA